MKIANNVQIGTNAVVEKGISDNCVGKSIPTRIVKINGKQ